MITRTKISMFVLPCIGPFLLAGCAGRSANVRLDEGVQVVKDQRVITMRALGSDILSYHHAVAEVPEAVDPVYRRSAFIHPLRSPKGHILTRIQPPDHYHHYGIWNPWTKARIEGREVDFWNLKKGQGTVRFAGVDFIRPGNEQGAFRVRHEHVELAGPDAPRTVIKETWEIRAAAHKLDGHTVWVADLISIFTNVLDTPIELEQYRYGGGLGFRTTELWNKDNCSVLTSEGKTRADADGTRARWCDVNGAVGEDDRAGIVFLSHPDNREHPEPVRVWPCDFAGGTGEMFFEFCPIRLHGWTLEPQKENKLQYRMIVYDGEIDPKTAELLWQSYAKNKKGPPI